MIGRWESVEPAADGRGAMVEFTEILIRVSAGLLVHSGTYTVSNDELHLLAPGAEKPTRLRLEFVGAQMIQTEIESGFERILERVRGPVEGESMVVGVWRYPHETGGTAFVTFVDSEMFFRLPQENTVGRYRVVGDRVLIELGERKIRWQIVEGEGGIQLVGKDGRRLQAARGYFP